jgi:hypothetical protein
VERCILLDDDARACLQLADVLAEDVAAGTSPEPIELGMSHVEVYASTWSDAITSRADSSPSCVLP